MEQLPGVSAGGGEPPQLSVLVEELNEYDCPLVQSDKVIVSACAPDAAITRKKPSTLTMCRKVLYRMFADSKKKAIGLPHECSIAFIPPMCEF